MDCPSPSPKSRVLLSPSQATRYWDFPQRFERTAARYRLEPDLDVLAKIIGGGSPPADYRSQLVELLP